MKKVPRFGFKISQNEDLWLNFISFFGIIR